MITAAEARELTDSKEHAARIEREVEVIGVSIKHAATGGADKIAYSGLDFGLVNLYHTPHVFNNVQKMFMQRLTELGYTCRLIGEERHFVNVYLEISW